MKIFYISLFWPILCLSMTMKGIEEKQETYKAIIFFLTKHATYAGSQAPFYSQIFNCVIHPKDPVVSVAVTNDVNTKEYWAEKPPAGLSYFPSHLQLSLFYGKEDGDIINLTINNQKFEFRCEQASKPNASDKRSEAFSTVFETILNKPVKWWQSPETMDEVDFLITEQILVRDPFNTSKILPGPNAFQRPMPNRFITFFKSFNNLKACGRYVCTFGIGIVFGYIARTIHFNYLLSAAFKNIKR